MSLRRCRCRLCVVAVILLVSVLVACARPVAGMLLMAEMPLRFGIVFELAVK